MIKSAARKVMWVGRATVFLVGLAVVLALVLGVATTALGAPQATFKLGQTNISNAISSLVGSVAGPSLRIDNDSTAATATALDLQVEQGKAPLKVNADAGKATNLDADKIDGIDSAAFGRVAEADGYKSVQLTGSDQVLNSVKITPGAPNGFIKAEAVVQIYSPGNDGPSVVEATLHSPEEGDLTNYATGITVEPSFSGYDQLVVTAVIPVSSAGEKTIQVQAQQTNAAATIYASAALVNATYFPFGSSASN